MGAPEGFLGIVWGDDASAAALKFHLSCGSWEPWEGDGGYEACFDIDHPVEAFGRQAYVRLFRKQGKVEGLSLRFLHCSGEKAALAAAIREEFRLEASADTPYSVYADGSAVHFSCDSGDDSCQLTVTGPGFGQAFAQHLLQQGFRKLGGLGAR